MQILLWFSVLAAVAGLFTVSNATLGVGIICLACYLAICARLIQAERHHEERSVSRG